MSKKLKFLAMMLTCILLSINQVFGQASVGTVLWSEDFSGYTAGDAPSGSITNSHSGTAVYGGVTLTYGVTDGNGTTQIYAETSAGGTSPELLVAKGSGTFTCSGISNGGATAITVSYKQNGQYLACAVSGTGYSGSTSSSSAGNSSFDITVGAGAASTFTLTFTGPSGKKNVRLDNISVTVKTAGSGSSKTLVYNANGGSGSMANTTGATVNAATCTFTPPTCKVFDHWNTDSNNEGTSYNEGDVVAASTTLYAIWRNNPSDPTVTFSNGSYTTGGSALDLSTLFSSNSSGAVTYSVTNAGGTGASIAGTSFSATTAGSCTVQASQAADAPCYNAKTATATITVSAPTPATITLQNYDGDATTTGYYSGGSFTLPSENDFVCGDLTFVGWSSVTIDNSATKPSAATYHEPGESVTLGASNTFYAVFAESGGAASSSSSISSFEDGTYYLIDFHTYDDVTTYYSPTGTNAGTISSVELTSIVSVTNGVLTLDLTSNLLTNAMKYTITEVEENAYTIYNATTEEYIEPNTSTSFKKTDATKWQLETSGKRFMFWYGASTDRSVLYQHSYNGTGNVKTYGKRFGCYSKANAGRTNLNGDKEQYGSGYFFLVPASGGTTYSNYTTNCVNMRTIYLDAYHFGDTDGAKFAIYSWRNADASDNKLSDAFMTKVEDCYYGHLYEGEMPDNHDRVIFLRNASAAASPVKDGANKLNQTVDITTEANKDFFTIASGGAGNAYTGSWGVYTPNYAVTFSKNGVSTTNTWPADQCVASGSAATDPDVTPLTMGKTFVGWYQEAGGTNAWNFSTTVSAATTIYAKWNDVATKTIYLDASATLDGGKTWDADNTVLFVRAYIDGTSLGTEIKATAPISSCQPHVYAFTIPGNATHVSFARCATGTTELPADWSSNPPVYNAITGKTVESGKDHYVIDGWGSATLQNSTFTPTSYTISFAAGDYGSGDAPANDSKACGVTYVLPNSQVFSRNGYTMDGWSVNANGSTKDYNLGGSYTTDADQTFYPHWALATYTVTLTTNGGTINAGNVTSYVYGTGATLPTDVTKAHATFQGWYASSTFEGDRVYTIGTTEYGNKQYYAKWEDVKWTVTWKANGATVRTDENIVDGNKVASVPSAPSDLTTGSNGCDAEFVGWVVEENDPGALSISSQSSTPSGMFTNVAGSPAITGNVTFVAIYRQEQ